MQVSFYIGCRKICLISVASWRNDYYMLSKYCTTPFVICGKSGWHAGGPSIFFNSLHFKYAYFAFRRLKMLEFG